jgi:hypothetical protein
MILWALPFSASRADIDLQAHRQFLAQNRDLTAAELVSEFGRDVFLAAAPTDFAAAAFADSIDHYYSLTGYEKRLLERHGFAVTERVRPKSFGAAYLEIYERDLPLFVSTDAILHALHKSYDTVLADLESVHLRPQLETALTRLHRALPQLAARYAGQPALSPMLGDLDLYLAVPLRLLKVDVAPLFPENEARIADLLSLVAAEQLAAHSLFGESGRTLDYSQFTIRGHYTDDPRLGEYFQAMIWLGRTELYTESPRGTGVDIPAEAIRRQVIDIALLDELIGLSRAGDALAEIERVLVAFVGEQDNLTLLQFRAALESSAIERAADLLDEDTLSRFQAEVRESAGQQILSQILMKDPLDPEPLAAAPAFLLIGQRFVIDSYITGSVVFDKIQYEGRSVFRGLPSTLDVLFALGNNSATQFLPDELERYHYAPNLAALRFLVDGQDPGFWDATLYNGWLNAIRTLSPPADRQHLPAFMQTNAWWQHKMNTQLAAWSQLRHDNLLYAKQSYTGGIVCEFPETFVEPEPDFYRAVSAFAGQAARVFDSLRGGLGPRLADYFLEMAAISDTLTAVAEKELSRTPLSPEEKIFLRTVLFEIPVGCTTGYGGWYSRLYYTGEAGLFEEDLVVADIHTQPTDSAGALIGQVLHVGTGPLDLAFLVADLPEREEVAFVGPVMSYYEHVTLGFDRLTDEEWKSAYARPPSLRPIFANLYLAGIDGDYPGEAISLATEERPTQVTDDDLQVEKALLVVTSHPNPFNSSTLIRFSVDVAHAGQHAELAVYNVQGQRIRGLLSRILDAGHFSVRWDGLTEAGETAASGQYIYRLRVGELRASGKMSLIR